MIFNGLRGGHKESAEKKWNEEFAPRVNQISNAGLDGLIDIFHKSAVLRGGMGCEVVPFSDLSDIKDVYPFDPAWMYWERQSNYDWEPYQYQNGLKVYVRSQNFFYVPTDPDIDDPRGNLMFTPALVAIDNQLQTYADLALVLHKAGYPREDIELLREPLLQTAKEMGMSTAEDIQKFLDDMIQAVHSEYTKLEADSTYVHYDNVKLNTTKGANERGGIDVRPYFEALDPQIMNALGQMGIFQNRTSGVTETWGTVQYRIFVQLVESLRRASKRLIESVAKNWLRVNGIQAIPHLQWTVIDWEADKTRKEVQLLNQEFYWLAQKYGWIDANEAALEVVGHKAEGERSEDNSESNSEFIQRRWVQLQVESIVRNLLEKGLPKYGKA
jgi:chemotaxis protein histidine kinase CheA